jgi:hypothetical protein
MSTPLPNLQVSTNRRHLIDEHGKPFFWLGDTAWELFHRLTREEATLFFDTRQRQGFNVIQAVALAEMDGINTPNAYGDTPFVGGDPGQPNEAYFQLVDEYIAMATTRSMYVALLPTWGDKVAKGLWASQNVIFDEASLGAYGRWIGKRYRSTPGIIWMIGGDRPVVHGEYDDRPLWRALAEGIREAIPHALMAFHPSGGHSSSEWLHDEPWLDVNTMQSGHGGGRDVPVWERIAADYAREPTKPTLDSEPNYEDHPVSPWPTWDPANGYFRDHDVRKQLYRSVFAGGCGVTYGHHSIWQFCGERNPGINHTDRSWQEALTRPAAEQVIHLRRLIESLPMLERVPLQQAILQNGANGATHACATGDSAGRYLLVYIPTAEQTVQLDLGSLGGPQAEASWYNPRSGEHNRIGPVATGEPQTFTTPAEGPDWVLVVTRE